MQTRRNHFFSDSDLPVVSGRPRSRGHAVADAKQCANFHMVFCSQCRVLNREERFRQTPAIVFAQCAQI